MSTIHSVVIAHDTDVARALSASSSPGGGTLVAQAGPDLRRRHELGWDLLIALGKNEDVSGAGRTTDEDWELLLAWLKAYRVRHLAVLDAQWLPAPLVDDLVTLAVTAGADLWLVAYEPFGEAHLDALAAWPHRQSSLEQLQAALAVSDEEPPTARSFPTVPTSPFTTFLADCHPVLDMADADAVDARFRAVHEEATAWLAASDVTEDSVIDWLRRQVDRCITVDEILVAVRAVQAAAFIAGWLVQVELLRFLATAVTAPNATVASPAAWGRLGAYREPYRASACVYAALGCGTDDMQGATVAGVAHSGASVMLDDVRRPVPAGAEVYLRAQVELRTLEGAAGGDPLFADDGGPLRDRYLVDAIRAPVLEVAFSVLSTAVARARPEAKQWMSRWGLSVQDIR